MSNLFRAAYKMAGVKSYNVVGDKLEVTYDEAAWPESGPIADGSAPAANGYQSEFAQILTSGWDYKNHGDGLMYDRDGNRLSAPENLDPLPAEVKHDATHDGVGALQQWKQDHPYYANGIDVDGNGSLVAFPGDTHPHARYSSTQKPGYLVLEAGIVAPPPPVVQPLPVPANRDKMTILAGWPKSQIQLATRGLSNQEVQCAFEVPADHPITKDANGLGKWDVAQILGNYNINTKLEINDRIVTDWDARPTTAVHLTLAVGGDVSCDIRLQRGDRGVFSFRNEDGNTGDNFFQFAPPK